MKTDKFIKVQVNKSTSGKFIKTTTKNGRMVELKVLKVINGTNVNEISKLVNGVSEKEVKNKRNINGNANTNEDGPLLTNALKNGTKNSVDGSEVPLTSERTLNQNGSGLKRKSLDNKYDIDNNADKNSLQNLPVPSKEYSYKNNTLEDNEMSIIQPKPYYPKKYVDAECQTDIKNSDLLFTFSELVEFQGSYDIDGVLSETNIGIPQNKMSMYEECKKVLTLDQFGNLPIHVAVLNNDPIKVTLNCLVLQKRKYSINLRNKQNETPLQIAVKESETDYEIINLLLQFGANLTDIDEEGNNIIHLAIIHQRLDIFEYLLHCAKTRKVDIDLYNYEGQTPLLLSIMNGSTNIEYFVKLLLKYGAQPNFQDKKSGKTALFHAAETYNESLVKLLLENGADPKVKNYFGTSPYDATFELDDIPQTIKDLILKKVKVYDKIIKNASAQVKRRLNKSKTSKNISDITNNVSKNKRGPKLRAIKTYAKSKG